VLVILFIVVLARDWTSRRGVPLLFAVLDCEDTQSFERVLGELRRRKWMFLRSMADFSKAEYKALLSVFDVDYERILTKDSECTAPTPRALRVQRCFYHLIHNVKRRTDDISRNLTEIQRETVLAHLYALAYSYGEDIYAERLQNFEKVMQETALCRNFFAHFSQTYGQFGGEWSLFEDFKQHEPLLMSSMFRCCVAWSTRTEYDDCVRQFEPLEIFFEKTNNILERCTYFNINSP
jgi:hypothetical protein